MAATELGPLRMTLEMNSEQFKQKNAVVLQEINKVNKSVELSNKTVNQLGNAFGNMSSQMLGGAGPLASAFGNITGNLLGMINPIEAVVAAGLGLTLWIINTHKEIDSLNERIAALDKTLASFGMSDQQKLAELRNELVKAEHELSQANAARPSIAGPIDLLGQKAISSVFGQKEVDALSGLTERRLKAEEKLKGIVVEIQAVEERIAKSKEDAAKKSEQQAKTESDRIKSLKQYGPSLEVYQQSLLDQYKLDQKAIEDKKQLEIERIDEVHQYAVAAITDEQQREIAAIEEKYRKEEERLRKLFAEDARLKGVLANLEKAKNREVDQVKKTGLEQEKKKMAEANTLLGETQTLASSVATIFGATGDSWLSDLQEALSVIQAMAAAINAVNSIVSIFSGGGVIGSLFKGPDDGRPGSIGAMVDDTSKAYIGQSPKVIVVISPEISDSQFGKAIRFVQRNDPKRRLN